MAIIIGKNSIQAGPTNTSSTSIFTLASFDYTNLPGIGAIASRFGILANIKIIMLTNSGDHGARAWERSAFFSFNSGNGFVVDSVNNNSGTAGIIGSSNSSTIAFDTNGTTGRIRVTPSTTDSYDWYCRMDLTICQMS